MAIDLTGKCVVVTGAGGGIGSSLCKQLISSNAKVALIGRTKETLDRACKASSPESGQACVWQCDVSDPEQVSKAFSEIISMFGSIDVLVNGAGIFYRKPLLDCSLDDMQEIYHTNVFGVFNCTKEVYSHFIDQKRGHIINIASLSGLTGIPYYSGYGDSKAAVVRLSEEWRRELAEYNIFVTTVFNYFTATSMVFPQSGPDPVVARFPLVPLLKPETVAQRIIRVIYKPKKELWIPRYTRLMMSLPYLIPELGDNLQRIFPHGKPAHWRLE